MAATTGAFPSRLNYISSLLLASGILALLEEDDNMMKVFLTYNGL
jgi:hypothetical protein